MNNWRLFYLGFFLYRVACTLVGELIVVRLTSLGDARRFQGHYKKFSGFSGDFHWLLDSSQILEAFGILLSSFMPRQYLLMSSCYQIITFIGLVVFLNSINPKYRIFAAILLLSPSFNVWSSVASKESFIVFSVAIICSNLIDIYNGKFRFRIIYIPAFFILLVFKPHYFIPLLFFYSCLIFCKFIKQKEFIVLIFGFVSLFLLFYFKDTVDKLSFDILPHFITDVGQSTRAAFWEGKYDVFTKAPEGMLLSLIGPTFKEALSNPLQMVSFLESLLILIFFLILTLRSHIRVPAFAVLVVLFSVFWLFFVNYPFGVMNPGSAIRYRTGYYLIMVMAFVVMLSRESYENWRFGEKSSWKTISKKSKWIISPTIKFRTGFKIFWKYYS